MEQHGEQRQVFVEMLKEKLRQWATDIDQLERQTDTADEPARRDYRQLVAGLKKQRKDVDERIARLEESDRAAWTQMRPDVERAVTSLGEAIRNAKHRLIRH